MKFYKKFALAIFILFSFFTTNFLYAQDFQIITKEIQESFTPQSALDSLKVGNLRYVNDSQVHRKLIEEAELTSYKQFPFAAIIGCIDSRAPAEFIFDQGIGSVFNARIAGNVATEDVLGSLEFACKVSGAKLIVVFGHDHCGAVKGAIDNVRLGNLTAVLDKIKPAVDAVTESGDRSSNNSAFVDEVARENVMLGIRTIKEQSPILNEMINKGEIGIVGAMYDLESGRVTFFENK